MSSKHVRIYTSSTVAFLGYFDYIFYTDNIIKYTHKKALSIIQRAFFGDKK